MFDESRKNRRGMSYPKRPRRTKSTCASSPSDSAKVIRNIEVTKQRLEQLAEKYKGINVVDGFLTDLWYALGIQNQGGQKKGGKPSRYALYQMQDGTMLLISIRASGHNANADKYVEHPPVPDKNLSIVLQKKKRKNQFKSNPSINLCEYVYVNQKIRNVENPLSKIAYSLINYLDTGQYKDLTGVAIPHGNITENINYNRNMEKNRIRLTESQLNRVVKESVKRVLKESFLEEPEEIVDGMWLTSIEFTTDGNGTVELSFDATEEEPDGDSFVTEFEINTDMIDIMMNTKYVGDRISYRNPEITRCVRLYQGVMYSKEAEIALKLAIVRHYVEDKPTKY